MSANDGATITSKPWSCSAHGACSRDEPQPKFGPVTRIGAPSAAGSFSSKSCLLRPVVEDELAEAGALDPLEELLGDDLIGVHVGAVEHRRSSRSLARTASRDRLQRQLADVRRSGRRGGRGGHRGLTRWVRPPRPWRPSKLRFDVRRAALAGLEDVRVHAQAHRAAGSRHSKPASLKMRSSPSCSACALHGLRAGDDHRADARAHAACRARPPPRRADLRCARSCRSR